MVWILYGTKERLGLSLCVNDNIHYGDIYYVFHFTLMLLASEK